MEIYLKEFLFTARAVLFGRTRDACAILDRVKPEKLMAFQLVIGFCIGLQTLHPLRVFGFPLFLTGMTILWLFLYAAMIESKREDMTTLYRYFFGSSLFLLPGVIPIVGPKLLEILILGWPCVLSRFIAHGFEQKPGRIFCHLTLPVIGLYATLQIVLLIVGNIF